MKIAGSRKSGREVRFGGGRGRERRQGSYRETVVPFSLDPTFMGCARVRKLAQQPQGTGNPLPGPPIHLLHFTLCWLHPQHSEKKKILAQSICQSLSFNPYTVLEQGANQIGER